MPISPVAAAWKFVPTLLAGVVLGSLSGCTSLAAPVTLPRSTATASPTPVAASQGIVRPLPRLTATPAPGIAEVMKPLHEFERSYGDPPEAKEGRIRIPRIGVDAPIGARQAPANLDLSYIYQLGPTDVVWYDFAASPGHGGEPGARGNAVLSAHVDYNYSVRWTQGGYYTGPGVFAGLGSLEPDDGIEVTFRGRTSRYIVVWKRQVPEKTDWASVYASDVPEGDSLTLISCTGTFNPATLEYDSRTIVRARLWTEGATASRAPGAP